jgi:hypothetical protein
LFLTIAYEFIDLDVKNLSSPCGVCPSQPYNPKEDLFFYKTEAKNNQK